MKKILSVILTLALIVGALSLLGVTAGAESETSGESASVGLKPGDTFYYKPDRDDVSLICVYAYDEEYNLTGGFDTLMTLVADGVYSVVIPEETIYFYLAVCFTDGTCIEDMRLNVVYGGTLLSEAEGNFYDSTIDSWSTYTPSAEPSDPDTPTEPELPGKLEIPELPDITLEEKTYSTLQEMGTYDFINAFREALPQTNELSYENGVLTVIDFGAVSAEFYSYVDGSRTAMTLADGYWSAEIDESIYSDGYGVVHYYGVDKEWDVQYRNEDFDYIRIYGFGNDLDITGSTVEYIYFTEDNFEIRTRYDSDGNIEKNIVRRLGDFDVAATYNSKGEPQKFEICVGGAWCYYLPNQGWSSAGWEYQPIDAPKGYESVDTEYLVNYAPCTIPGVNDTEEENPVTPIPVPEIPIITAPHEDISFLPFDIVEFDANFPQTIEVEYADGVLSVKDFGAGYAEFYNGDFFYEMTLVDGYWTVELDERIVGFEIIHFYSGNPVNSDTYWIAVYVNNVRDPYIQVIKENKYTAVSIDLMHDIVGVSYEIGDLYVTDVYNKGILYVHEVQRETEDASERVHYNPDRSVQYITVYSDSSGYSYYFPGQGWSEAWDRFIATDAPAGYEDKDESYFTSAIPCFIPCEHKWIEATCESPKTCSVCELTEGEALGHNFQDATCESPKTCSVCELTEGEALGHDFAEATTEAPKTCTVCGKTEGEKLPTPEEPDTPNLPETPETPETPEEPEETNWFLKIIKAIIDFFKNLFGIKTGK